MPEYTILAIIGVGVSLLLDTVLRTFLVRARTFWVFWVVMFALTTIINGYLTWRPIVSYGDGYFLNLRLITIPVEDYLFGFALITMNLVVWEYFTRRSQQKQVQTKRT